MAHQPYPTFDLDCVKDVIRMVRGRTVREEFPLFAKCLYGIIGAALAASIGEPDHVDPLSFGDQPVDGELQECLAALQTAETEGPFGAAEGDVAIDPATLAMLIQLAVSLITKWLERRNQGS